MQILPIGFSSNPYSSQKTQRVINQTNSNPSFKSELTILNHGPLQENFPALFSLLLDGIRLNIKGFNRFHAITETRTKEQLVLTIVDEPAAAVKTHLPYITEGLNNAFKELRAAGIDTKAEASYKFGENAQ